MLYCTRYVAHTEVCLKCRGLELALRFLGRFAAQEFHAFYAGFCRFLSNFGEMFEPSLPQPTRFTEAVRCPSRRVSAVCALAAAGCVELNKMIRAKIKNELSKQLEQVKYAAYGDDFYAVGIGLELIQRSVRDGDPFEAEASALMDADVNAGHGPAFAGKTDFAERDQILAHGQIAQRGDQRERRGHIGYLNIITVVSLFLTCGKARNDHKRGKAKAGEFYKIFFHVNLHSAA